ncbi:hypothetical protein PIB30_077968 [Stylosanthes scabra]|uniref:RRM domain-containing protein n=1 Tax=Stylosanthes scabra TaxID=79078 RepID=A0ABU6SR47_9FABA|nr:hypothetical protein [Stylosanthes scabra]
MSVLPFAFVRFMEFDSARKAMETLQGKNWEGRNLIVSMAKFRRNKTLGIQMSDDVQRQASRKRITQKWIEIRNPNQEKDKTGETHEPKKPEPTRRKEIEGIWAEDQKERSERSLLGVSVKPIEFRKVMNQLLDEWNGPGEIECRDVGPYRCLVTFSTPEIRDGAMDSELLHSVFDEKILTALQKFGELRIRGADEKGYTTQHADEGVKGTGLPCCGVAEDSSKRVADLRQGDDVDLNEETSVFEPETERDEDLQSLVNEGDEDRGFEGDSAELQIDRKLEGKKRVDLRPKKQRNGRNPPCIQGRTLATRTIMSETLNTREKLVRCGIIGRQMSTCVLCDVGEETDNTRESFDALMSRKCNKLEMKSWVNRNEKKGRSGFQ